MALAFRRWGPPVISLVFATGLQLSDAVQESIGWVLIGVSLLLAFVYVLVERRTEPSASAASLLQVDRDESINITTHNQFGGTNIGKLNIERPQPDMSGTTLAHHEKTDEGYRSAVALQLKDQFAAQALEVVVVGSTLTSVEVEPDVPASVHSQAENPLSADRAEILVNPPLYPRYLVTVRTQQPDPNLKIKAQIR